MSKFTAILAALSLASASAEEPSTFLSDIYSGKVPKSKVEVVLAQHNEDIAWSDPLSSVRTVYCKGKQCGADALRLPNVGREGHTFLHHIVHNYENLSDWTVFSQAERPTMGYVNHRVGGGHMLSGSKFEDYLVHGNESQGKDDSLFLMTSKVHLPTFRHSIRSSFKTNPSRTPAAIFSKSAVCPKDEPEAEDVWGAFQEHSQTRFFLAHKCGTEEKALGHALRSFWEDFVKLPMPAGEVVHYTQGARFAASRGRIHQRSKAFYQRLLTALSIEEDPCMNYLFEFAWYYLIGTPAAAPCPLSAADLNVAQVEARILDENSEGMSGGNSTEEEDEPATLVVIKGTMEMLVDEGYAENITENETAIGLFEEKIAEACDIQPSCVDVELTLNVTSQDQRRLADTTLNVAYTITLDEESSGDDTKVNKLTTDLGSDTGSAWATSLKASLETSLGVAVTISDMSTPTTETVTQTPTTTTIATTTTDGGLVAGSIRSTLSGFFLLIATTLFV